MITLLFVVVLLFPSLGFTSLTVTPETIQSWDQGFCQELLISNNGSQRVDGWTVRIRGVRLASLYDKRSANWEQHGQDILVTPAEWNRRIDPQQTRRVGYCIQDGTPRILSSQVSIIPGTTQTDQEPSRVGPRVLRFPADGERPTSLYDLNQDNRVDMVFMNNHRNVRSTQGEAVMTFDPQKNILSYQHDLQSIVQKDPAGGVHGYPEVFVGRKPRGGATTNGWTHLPRLVSDISSLVFSTDFSITNSSGGPLNMAAEGWIVTDPMRSDFVQGQEIEFMVKFFKENINAAGSKVDRIEHPVVVDGVETLIPFDVYKSTGKRDFFTFVPDRNLDGKKITTDLKPLLDRLSRHIPYSITNYYFMNREIGSEYGLPGTTNSRISWEMRHFCLSVNGDVAGGFGCEKTMTGKRAPSNGGSQSSSPSSSTPKSAVTNCTASELQKQITNAQANDTITLDCPGQTIAITAPIIIDKSLTIDGKGVILDGGNKSRGFVIAKQVGRIIDGRINPTPQQGGAGIHVVFKNMTRQNFRGASFRYADKTKSPQTTTDGSALYVGIRGHATLDTITAINNQTSTDGGVIYIHGGDSGTLTVRNSTFRDNSAQGGGSVIASQQVKQVTVEKTTFERNISRCTTEDCLKGERGGAIRVRAGGTLTVSDSIFSGNKANLGGAINILQSAFDINNTQFIGNESLPARIVEHKAQGLVDDKKMTQTRGGGAIYADTSNRGLSRIRNSVFDGNVGQMDGGAIYMFLRNAHLTIENSQFRNNRVLKDRGAALGIYGKATITNTTFTNNTVSPTAKTSKGLVLYPEGTKDIVLKNSDISQQTTQSPTTQTRPTNTNSTNNTNNGDVRYTASFRQVTKNNQDPIVKKIGADGKEVWSVVHDTSPVDVRATMVKVDAQGNPRVVFSLDGGSNDKGYITRTFVDKNAFSRAVFPSFGRAKGAFKGSVIAQLDPNNGKIIKATFLMARTNEGDINANNKANSMIVNDVSFDAQGNIVITAKSRYLPPRAGSTAKNYRFHPDATDKTKKDGAWNVIITLSNDLTRIVDSKIVAK